VAEGARRHVAVRGWGPHDVDDKTWDDAFSKLAEALTGRKDVATVVQLSRMGIISDREGLLKGYVITGNKVDIPRQRDSAYMLSLTAVKTSTS
jgi:hypothetical protein